MHENPKILSNKKPNIKKLIEYGFKKRDDIYSFSADIMEGSFCLNIYVDCDLSTKLELIDTDSNEEYTLIFNQNAVGSFVGNVRSECEAVLNELAKKCYEPDVFKLEQTKLVIAYIKDKYKLDAEYLWEKLPNNAIFREETTRKWFAVLLTVDKSKLGIDGEGEIEIMDLKENPKNIEKLLDGTKYFAGFHMNKKHWYTLCLDERMTIDEIYDCIDNSYNMIKRK